MTGDAQQAKAGPVPFDGKKLDRMVSVGSWLQNAVKHWLGQERMSVNHEFSQMHYEFGFRHEGEEWRVLVFRASDRPEGR